MPATRTPEQLGWDTCIGGGGGGDTKSDPRSYPGGLKAKFDPQVCCLWPIQCWSTNDILKIKLVANI